MTFKRRRDKDSPLTTEEHDANIDYADSILKSLPKTYAKIEDLAKVEAKIFTGRYSDLSGAPDLSQFASTDQIPDLTGYALITQVQALATQIAVMQDQIDALPDGSDQPTEPTIGAPRLTGSLPDVDQIQGDGTWTRDLKTAFTVEGDPSLDSITWSISGAGSSVTADGIASGPLSALRSSVSVIATATNSQGQRQTAWSVTVRAPDSTDVTPPALSAPHLVIDQMAGEITAGLDTSEQAEVRFLVIPEGTPAPTPAQFAENRDGSGSLALASAVLQSAGPGAVRAPISWAPDQRARVVAMATDAAGNSTRMEIGSLSNRTFIADFNAPDGTALADYTADTGQAFTDIDSDLAISGGRVTNVVDQAGVVRVRSFRVSLSSGYGRLSAVIRLSDDENAGVGIGWGSFAARVRGPEVNFSLYDAGAASPRDSTFETIQRSTPSLQDALLEIDIRPDGHDTYLDGEIIRSSDFDSARDDRMAYFEMRHQGDSIGRAVFDADHYTATLDGSIITGDGADQPQEPVTLGFAAQPTLDITGDAASYDAGTPAWPSDATGRTSSVTLADENGVLLETSGLDNPSGQTAAGTGLHTLTVMLNANEYEPVSVTVTATEQGVSEPGTVTGQHGTYQISNHTYGDELMDTSGPPTVSDQDEIAVISRDPIVLEATTVTDSYIGWSWPMETVEGKKYIFEWDFLEDYEGTDIRVHDGDPSGNRLERSFDPSGSLEFEGTGGTVHIGGGPRMNVGDRLTIKKLSVYEPADSLDRSAHAQPGTISSSGETYALTSFAPGDYEAMVDGGQSFAIYDDYGNLVGRIDRTIMHPQFVDRTEPVIEQQGDIVKMIYAPPYVCLKDDRDPWEYGEWVIEDSNGDEKLRLRFPGFTLDPSILFDSGDNDSYMREIALGTPDNPWSLSDYSGMTLRCEYSPFTRDGTAEIRHSNVITIS